MDSTETLVNPIPPTSYHFFSTNSMKNTTIYTHPSRPLYTVATNIKTDKQTRVSDTQSGRLVAIIDRKDLFPDTITFPDKNGGQAVNLHKWLEKSRLPNGFEVHVMRTGAESYRWKSDATHRLGLYTRDDPTRCIAHLEPSSVTQKVTLVLESLVEPLRDEVVVASLILEQRLRITERNINVGGGKFEQKKTVFGNYVHT